MVAPYTGAWIEITEPIAPPKIFRSLPTRERGLKYGLIRSKVGGFIVAPYTGAWIEIHPVRPLYAHSVRRSLHGSVD